MLELKNINLKFRRNEFVSISEFECSGHPSSVTLFSQNSTGTYSVGVVFQESNPNWHQTVLKNVISELNMPDMSKSERRERAIRALESVKLENQLFMKPGQLSKEQMQRLEIARVLVNDPDILVMDGCIESMENSAQVMPLLREIAGERLVIIMAEHAESAEKYVTRMIRIREGEVIEDSAPLTDKELQLEEIHDKVAQEKAEKAKKPPGSFKTSFPLFVNDFVHTKGWAALAFIIAVIGMMVFLSVAQVENIISVPRFIYLCQLVIELFLFACAGWLIEVTLMFYRHHRFINRGYLIGPYCPIYGMGVVLVTLVVELFIGSDPGLSETFLVGMVICGALEYFISWFLEKCFHARWWDYSTCPMNLNGRIWMGNLILFGIGTAIIIRWINPVLFHWMEGWSEIQTVVIATGIVIILAVDNLISYVMMQTIRKEIDCQLPDNTEEISRKVRILLKNKNILVRRINDAFPHLQARPAYFTRRLKEDRRELKLATKAFNELIRTEFERSADGAAERELKINQAVERMENARERLREIQEKLTYHRHF